MSENHKIEYKRELNENLEKSVIGFLNSKEGGIIFIGIDKMGKTIGVSNPDGDQLKIKDRLKFNIRPSCLGLFDLLSEKKEGKQIIRVVVASGLEKPYHLRNYGMTEKGCFIRIGSATEPMPQKMIEEYFAKRLRTSLGKIRSHRQDLTFEQLKIYYEGAGLKLGDQFLQNLELFTEDGLLNYAAYLLADVNNNSIKVAKYQGYDRSILIENNEYGFCCLVKATKLVLDKLELENKTSVTITSKQRKEKRLWDSIALREAVINAIIHNDYVNEVPPKFEIFDDRIEITSAGGLPDSLSQDEFFLGVSIPRNKELMRIFKDLGFVEQLGSGVPRMLKSYGKECFQFMPNFLRSTFSKSIPGELEKQRLVDGWVDGWVDGLAESQKKIIEMIAANPRITKKILAEKTGISSTAIDKNLKTLKDKGIIKRVGSDRSGHWQVVYKKGQ